MSFSIGDVLKFGWQTFKSRPWFLIGVTLVLFIIPSIPNAFADTTQGISLLVFLLNLVGWVLSLLMSIGAIKITLAFVDNGTSSFRDLFAHAQYLWRYFLASVLYGLIVIGGLILLIVPGIIWALKYQFAVYFIVDKDMAITDAFKRSRAITQGHKWNLFGYAIIQGILNAIGVLALGIGVLITAPVTMLAYAKIYRTLDIPTPPAPTLPLPSPQTPPIS